MSRITLHFMQRFMGELDTAIKNYVKGKDSKQKGTNIESGTNLDTMKTAGTFCIPNDSIAATLNLPQNYCGKLVVTDNGNGGYAQFYFPNHSPKIFQRLWWSNAWTDWIDYTGIEGAMPEIESYIDSAIADKQDKPIVKTAILLAGYTDVTFTGVPTTGINLMDFYTSKAGLNYTAIDDSTSGQITLTYDAQSADIDVYLKIEQYE